MTDSDSPSALLERAADRIENAAFAASCHPWTVEGHGDKVADRDGEMIAHDIGRDENARWISTMSPAVAQPLVEWLRYAGAQYEVAERRVRLHHARDVENWVSGSDRAALAFARQVLGES